MNRNYHIDLIHRKELAGEEVQWLKSLPYVHSEADVAFAHGDFICPAAWRYIFAPQDVLNNLAIQPEWMLFCGHTHHAAAWEVTDRGEVHLLYSPRSGAEADAKSFTVKETSRYVVNVGSVGYPRCDHCSTYVIYDTALRRVTFRHLPLDISAYAERLTAQGIRLPPWLGDVVG